MKGFALAVLFSFCSSSFARDRDPHRVEVDRTAPGNEPLNAIGVVSDETGLVGGSAFLVGPCTMMTNLHSVLDKSGHVQKTINYSAGYTKDHRFFLLNNISGRLVDYGRGMVSSAHGTTNSDWVVVKLNKSVGSLPGFGYFNFLQEKYDNAKKLTFQMAGFSQDESFNSNNGEDLSREYIDPSCFLVGFGIGSYLEHSCKSAHGNSGSPLFSKAPDGKYYVMGMNAAGTLDPNVSLAINFESSGSREWETQGDMIRDALNKVSCDKSRRN